jgi:ATP-dependent 26S proteasome regulatory subunit
VVIIAERRNRYTNAKQVTSHRYPEDVRNQTEQKGKGLVILLHGSPGSGKTLTAETAAECTERALLSASLSDLNQSDE